MIYKEMHMAPKQSLSDVYEKVEALDERVTTLETSRRIGRPPVIGDCALGNDGATCDAASLYRYHKGCRGESCSTVMSEYTQVRKDRKNAKATPVAAPAKKAAAKKAPAAPKKATGPRPKPAPAKKSPAAKSVAAPQVEAPKKRIVRKSAAA